MTDRPIIPDWEPQWAHRHPWIWSAFIGISTGYVVFGLGRYFYSWAPTSAEILGVVGGVLQFGSIRFFVNRPRYVPRWTEKLPFLDPRRQPRWMNLAALVGIGVSVVSVHVIQGVIFDRPGQIVWAVAFGFYFGYLGSMSQRAIERLRAESPLIEPVPPPPVPPPALPPTGSTNVPSHVLPSVLALATPIKRFFARIIDLWILILIGSGVAYGVVGESGSDDEFGAVFLLAVTGSWAISEIIMVAIRGQTLGKIALGIRIARSQEGHPPGLGRSAVRWLSMVILLGTIVPGVVAMTWMFWSRTGQTLYDKAGGTLVVETLRFADPTLPASAP